MRAIDLCYVLFVIGGKAVNLHGNRDPEDNAPLCFMVCLNLLRGCRALLLWFPPSVRPVLPTTLRAGMLCSYVSVWSIQHETLVSVALSNSRSDNLCNRAIHPEFLNQCRWIQSELEHAGCQCLVCIDCDPRGLCRSSPHRQTSRVQVMLLERFAGIKAGLRSMGHHRSQVPTRRFVLVCEYLSIRPNFGVLRNTDLLPVRPSMTARAPAHETMYPTMPK